MKRQAINHPKLKALRRRLGINRREALGLMTLLWHWTAEFCPRGDIGRFVDEDIAEAVDWPEEDAGRLVEALVEVGLVDPHDQHRLVVHDWHDHAEEWVVRKLQRAGDQFATGNHPRLGGPPSDSDEPLTSQRRDTDEQTADVDAPTQPSPAKPSQDSPSPATDTSGADAPPPAAAGNGSGFAGPGNGGGLGRDMGRVLELTRWQHVMGALHEIGIESNNVRQRIAERRDISPEIVRAVFAAAKRDEKVKDPVKIAAHRLQKAGVAELAKFAPQLGNGVVVDEFGNHKTVVKEGIIGEP